MKKTVIFLDLGGVLVELRTDPVARIAQILLARGYSKETVQSVTKTAEANWKALPASAGWIGTWAQEQQVIGGYFARLAQEIPGGPAGLADELFWLCHCLHHAGLYADVVAGLEELQAGYRLAIISNALPSTDWIIDRLNIRRYFEHIVLSAQVGCAKPDERIYRIALDAMEVRPQESIFVDNQMANIEAARKLGMQGIHFVRNEEIGAAHDFPGLLKDLRA